MIQDYLKAGYPALCVLTQEPHRAAQLIVSEGWSFYHWDCLQGIREAGSMKVVEEIKDPVEAINWLGFTRDSILIADNLHMFLEIPEVIQAIQNGVPRWKGIGNALVMISPLIKFTPEIEKFFTLIDLPLPDEESLHTLQVELCKSVNVNPNKRASRVAKGLTEFEAETAFALSLIKKGYCSTKVISEAKSQMIRKSGLLEFWTPESIQNVGGLNQLKMFIANRAKAFEIGNDHLSENYRSKKTHDITINSVTISTIHSVKGLDYSTVFLLGLDFLEPHNWSVEQIERLIYVAITRARYQLYILYINKTPFIEKLLASI